MNDLDNIFVGLLNGTVQGPALHGEAFDERIGLNLQTCTWEVFNGAQLPTLPFGVFGEIQQGNMNKSKVVLRFLKGYPEVVEFPVVTTPDVDWTDPRGPSKTSRQVVELATALVDEGDGIWSSVVQPLDDVHGLKVTKFDANTVWPVLHGQQFNRELNVGVEFTETTKAVDESLPDVLDPLSEVEPLTPTRSRVRTFVPPTDLLSSYVKQFPAMINLDLPRILKSISVFWGSQTGGTSQAHSGSASGSGISYSVNYSYSDVAQGSAALQPDIAVEMEEIWARNLPGTHLVFLLSGPVTLLDICDRVATIMGVTPVNEWPVFFPKTHTIIAKGGKSSVGLNVSISAGISRSPTSATDEGGKTESKQTDSGVTISTVQIPPCLHGALTISNPTATATSGAMTASLTVSGATPATLNQSATISGTATVNGSVNVSSLAATTPADVPRSGLYVTNYKVEPYDWGWSKVFVEVFDAANLTPPVTP